MRAVTGIDPLGRVAEREVAAGRQARCRLEHRRAILLGGPGIDRRFIDDDVAHLQRSAHGPRRREQRRQVGLARLVDGRRDGDDEEVDLVEVGRVAREPEIRSGECLGFNLPGPIETAAKLADPGLADVEADDVETGAREPARDRQSDIAEADHPDPTTFRHDASDTSPAAFRRGKPVPNAAAS